jgi:glycosyltransferase involved in cell wall biosynthesis
MTKVSIVTVVYNNSQTIRCAIESILAQDYPNIEYIIIDGASTDGTIEIVKSYGDRITKFISEPDRGIYDAMNKGISLASGDIIGILNSDDFYASTDIISTVVNTMDKLQVDSVFGDLVYVKPDNLTKIVRYYPSDKFHPELFAYGWEPPHPTFFVKRTAYQKYGLFKTSYKIGADFDLMSRFLYKSNISHAYIPKVMVYMRTGGTSTKNLNAIWINIQEVVRACRENGIKTNAVKVSLKYLTKVFQYLPTIYQ